MRIVWAPTEPQKWNFSRRWYIISVNTTQQFFASLSLSLSSNNFSPSVLRWCCRNRISCHVFHITQIYSHTKRCIDIRIYTICRGYISIFRHFSLSIFHRCCSRLLKTVEFCCCCYLPLLVFQWQNDKNQLHSFSSNEFTQSTFITPFTRAKLMYRRQC